MGDISIKGRSPLLKGGRVGFSRAGPVGNLPWVRGTSRPGVKKAPRGAEHKEAIKQEKRWKELDTKVKGKEVPGPEKGKRNQGAEDMFEVSERLSEVV